jgi:hypothetical protein
MMREDLGRSEWFASQMPQGSSSPDRVDAFSVKLN